MNKTTFLLLILLCITACKSTKKEGHYDKPKAFTLAFGSCNKLSLENFLWDDILKSDPDLWIWGGDIIYADTEDVTKIQNKYNALKAVKGYNKLQKKVAVIGTWDDHDYGKNDGGAEFSIKKESQAAFLDFMNVLQDDPRRRRAGIYAVHNYYVGQNLLKILVLDTRFFRTALSPDTSSEKRFKPNPYGEGTILGEAQWHWLETQLMSSKADFNIIVSSIQVLSGEHGFESWGNFPLEVDRLKELIAESHARGVILLSGDRHISEFSKTTVEGLPYPLIDFTSSGLTHAYDDFSGEINPFRVGKVVSSESFGLVKLDMQAKTASFFMVGDEGEILGGLIQQY